MWLYGVRVCVRLRAPVRGCAAQLRRLQKEQAARGKKKKDDKKKGSILVTCPLCRAKTKVVPASRFDGDVKRVMSNSFGFGGTNASLVFKRLEA